MFVQKEVLRSGVGMTFAQTYELDLPKSGQLMSLVLYLRAAAFANAHLATVRWRLIDYITKIEVIADGAELIKAFDGRQALACAFYDDFREPVSMWRTYSTCWQRQWIPIHFGRRFLDKIYGLDLSKYNQVTLKITNDASASEFQTDIDIDVIAYWQREGGAAFAGYFREEEWKTWAPAAAAVEYNNLPVALPIRRVLLRARPACDTADSKAKSSMHALMDTIDFTFRTGQTRVYQGTLETLGHLSVMEMPALAETMWAPDRAAGTAFEVGVGYVTNAIASPGGDADSISPYPNDYKRMDIQHSKQEVGNRSTQAMLEGIARGHGYGHCVPLWYALEEDLTDMLDPEAEKVVKADITCRANTTVSGTHDVARSAIILSRLVR